MPGELPGHHGPLHSARPGATSAASAGPAPCRGPLAPCCHLACTCPPQREAAPAALVLWHSTAWHGTARLSQGCTDPSIEQQHLCAFLHGSSSSSSPREGGDGGVHARTERAGHWAKDQVTGTKLQPREDLNPCLCPGRQPPRCPPCAMRLLSLLLLLGLCCLWARLVSAGERGAGTARARGAGGPVLQEDARPHAQGRVRPWPGCSVPHSSAVSPHILARFRSDWQPPRQLPWEGCPGSWEPSPPGPRCRADGCTPACSKARAWHTDASVSPQDSPSPCLDLDPGSSLCSHPAPDSRTASQPSMEGSISCWISTRPPDATSTPSPSAPC